MTQERRSLNKYLPVRRDSTTDAGIQMRVSMGPSNACVKHRVTSGVILAMRAKVITSIRYEMRAGTSNNMISNL